MDMSFSISSKHFSRAATAVTGNIREQVKRFSQLQSHTTWTKQKE
jgi:hypothetical protein